MMTRKEAQAIKVGLDVGVPSPEPPEVTSAKQILYRVETGRAVIVPVELLQEITNWFSHHDGKADDFGRLMFVSAIDDILDNLDSNIRSELSLTRKAEAEDLYTAYSKAFRYKKPWAIMVDWKFCSPTTKRLWHRAALALYDLQRQKKE